MGWDRLRPVLPAAGALSLLLGVGVAQAQTTVRMEMSEFMFTPNTATVRAGETVTFELPNVGRFPHDLRITGPGGFSAEAVAGSDAVAGGESATLTVRFPVAGTYRLICPVLDHEERGMVGTLTVQVAGAQAAPAQVPGAAPARAGGLSAAVAPLVMAAGAASVAGGWLLRRRSRSR